jgi:hypothetical protein
MNGTTTKDASATVTAAAATTTQPEVTGTVLGSEAAEVTTAAITTEGDKPAPTDPAKGETKSAEANADGKTGPDYAAFKYPEGVKPTDEVEAEFKAFAKSNNLTQEQAQAYLDRHIADSAKGDQMRTAKLGEIREGWRNELRADKVYGGDKLSETHALARKAIASRADAPVLRDLLNRSGFGDHPVLVKIFADYGKLLSEDKVRTGSGGQAPAKKDAATALYGGSSQSK